MALDIPDLMTFYDELDRALEIESDRAAVVLAVSGLDLMLTELLDEFLIEDAQTRRRLYDNNGALGTFSSKIALAFALGLLSAGERRDLDLVRAIRNEFAHKIAVTLDSGSTADRCRALEIGERLYVPAKIPFMRDEHGEAFMFEVLPPDADVPIVDLEFPHSEPRQRFVATAKSLIRCIAARVALARVERREQAKEFEVDEPDLVQIRSLEAARQSYVDLLERLPECTELRSSIEKLEPGDARNESLLELEQREVETAKIRRNCEDGIRALDAHLVIARYGHAVVVYNRERAKSGAPSDK